MKDQSVTGASSAQNYKPFIKNISIEQVPSDRKKMDATNKTFFSNIKAQLNSIRTDVNKLVSKDNTKPATINKSYNVVSSQKAEPSNLVDKPTEINIQKRPYIESSQKFISPSALSDAKINKLTLQLSQQISKNEQIRGQFEQQRKNQTNLRNQIARLKQQLSRVSQQNYTKVKKLQDFRNVQQAFQKQKEQLTRTIQSLQLQLKKASAVNTFKPDSNINSNQKLKQQEKTISQLQNRLKLAEIDTKRVTQKLQSLETSKKTEIESIMRNCEQKISRAEAKSYKQLGAGFELKINQLLDENYSLKNKISQLESRTQKDRVQIQSLNSTIQAYEDRDRQVGRGANQIQMQNLRNKVMQLQQEIDKMQSEHDFQIMKLENVIDEMKSNPNNKGNDNKSFNQILKDQINEIENLKQKLREKTEMINKLKK